MRIARELYFGGVVAAVILHARAIARTGEVESADEAPTRVAKLPVPFRLRHPCANEKQPGLRLAR